jgi:CBS domain-containing protein
MLETLEQLLGFARTDPRGSDLPERLSRFLDWLDAHEHAENALMQEFLLLDEVRRHERRMRVAYVMNCDVSSCSPNDTLETVARIMAERGCNLVVVLDESRHLRGTITDRDLWMGAYREKAPLAAIVASVAVSQATPVCPSDEEVSAAELRMQRNGIGLAAVLNESGEFVGIVTLGRIAACRELSI